MLFKPTTTMDLTVARDGRQALKDLKISVRYETLTPDAFARLTARIEAAFEELSPIIDESPDPTRAHLYSIAGGARG